MPKLVQAMDRMEKMLERIESRQQKADSETKSAYTTVISYLKRPGETAEAQPTAPTDISTKTKKRPSRKPLLQSTVSKAQKKQ